jgi:hypothetical protein
MDGGTLTFHAVGNGIEIQERSEEEHRQDEMRRRGERLFFYLPADNKYKDPTHGPPIK